MTESTLTGATPGMTPFGRSVVDTPRQPEAGPSNPSSSLRYDPDLSLDAFCARYTSADNASFAEILHRSNILRRKKHAWAFEATARQNRKTIEDARERQKLVEMVTRMADGEGGIGLVEGASGRPGERRMVEGVVTREERLAIEAGDMPPPKLITARGETGEEVPDQSSSAEVVGPPSKRRKGDPNTETVSTWPHTTRNAFMYGPGAERPIHEPMPPPPHPSKEKAPLGGPKAIVYRNTRLGDEAEAQKRRTSASSSRHSTGTAASPTRSNIAAAISGTPHPSRDSMTPRVNGFSFVSAMPSPNPALLAPDEMDALMTWGEVASTPVRTDAQPPPEDRDPDQFPNFVEGHGEGPFKIPLTPHREELAMGLARKASRSLRERHGVGLGLGTRLRKLLGKGEWGRERQEVGLSPRREEMLSPAAKVLLKRTGGDMAERGMKAATTPRGSRARTSSTPSNAEQQAKEAEAKQRLGRARWDDTPAK